MTVAEMPTNAHHPAAPALCRVRVWPLPAGPAHHAERAARAIIRNVLAGSDPDVGREAVLEAEIIVAELAVNAAQHAAPPYELRVIYAGQTWPAWCEVTDAGTDIERVQRRLHGAAAAGPEQLTEGGRGLVMVNGLSAGRCAAYATTVCQSNAAGKAVGFALPGAGGIAP